MLVNIANVCHKESYIFAPILLYNRYLFLRFFNFTVNLTLGKNINLILLSLLISNGCGLKKNYH